MSAGRNISKDEAILIISGWRDSGAVIKAQCEIAPTAFSFRGRIVEFRASRRVRFLSVDGVTEFVFDVKDDFDCWYVEPRDFPEEESICALTFFFLPRPGYASNKDFIALSELP
jgi:hypothetical protein